LVNTYTSLVLEPDQAKKVRIPEGNIGRCHPGEEKNMRRRREKGGKHKVGRKGKEKGRKRKEKV
jgi:hypothetical protein